MKTVALIALLLALSACSNKGIYEEIQRSERQKCTQLPDKQYEECLQKNRTTYEEYQRQRRGTSRQ